MIGPRLRTLLVAAAAVLLHLGAHLTGGGARETLPEDHPAFVGNPALARGPDEGVFAAVGRAAKDPAATWLDAADTVGRARWRPATTTLYVLERAACPSDPTRCAALVSLALHVLVALGAMRLAMSLTGDARAATVAGLLAAASPAALSAAAWPARQGVVLAAAFAVGGTLVALRGGVARLVVGGALVALAGLAHEAAFGWALAFPLLRRASSATKPSALSSWPFLVAPAAAFVGRCAFLGGLGVSDGRLGFVGALDGAAGIAATFVAFALPAKTHFADGPFAFGVIGRLAAVAVLAVGAAFVFRRVARPSAAAASAAMLALAPLVVAAAAGGAPFQDANLYLVLPLLATAAGALFADFAARGGALRTASVAAAAMLLAASVAATERRAPSYRTRAGLVQLAVGESPRSLVARTWDVASRGRDSVGAVAADVRALAADVDADAARVRGDAVAAATISTFFSDYAGKVNGSSLPLHDVAYDAAEAAATTAADLRPNSWRTWSVLALLRRKMGMIRGAMSAAVAASKLAPDNVGVLTLTASTARDIGDSRFAADTYERAMTILRADPKRPALDDDLVLEYARTLAADGAWRVPDVASDFGFRYRFDLAAEAIEPLMKRTPSPRGARQALYDVYLRYGDMLASADRTAMAIVAYQKAVDLTGGSTEQQGAQHLAWLVARLKKEVDAAQAHFDKADKEFGRPDVGNALADMYVVLCRANQIAEADDLFAKLEREIGRIDPALRFHRAVQRFAARETPEDQQRAETELRQVLRDDPTILRARYELARVLEWEGTFDKLREAQTQYAQAARDGVAEDWGLDAQERAQAIDGFLRRESEARK